MRWTTRTTEAAKSLPPRAEAPAAGERSAPGWWCDVSVRAGLAVAKLSRWAGRGGGSIIGGRVTLAMQPDALRRLSAGRRVVLVSGTNGKTTTSHMVAAALRTQGAVAHNASGSNMADGAVAALAASRDAHHAVLEVDELHVAAVARESKPVVIVLLNLTRDQLDRASEVRKTAATIGSALAELPETTVIANADDPMIVSTAEHAAGPVVWVAAGAQWREDTLTCPRCGRVMGRGASGWRCECGLARPAPHWWLDGDAARTAETTTPLTLALPGQFNRTNALMALAAAGHEHVPADAAAAAIGRLGHVQGRYATVTLGPRTLRLLLAKNPAGWAATLSMLTTPRPLLIVVNAREADGRDTSWLWDVDFPALGERPIAASGERAADLGVRLSYADLPHHTAPDPLDALAELPEGEVDVVANYTAFYALRRRLGARG